MPGKILGLDFVRPGNLRVSFDAERGKLLPGDCIRLDDPPRGVKADQLLIEDGIVIRGQEKDVVGIQAFVTRAVRPVLDVTHNQQGLKLEPRDRTLSTLLQQVITQFTLPRPLCRLPKFHGTCNGCQPWGKLSRRRLSGRTHGALIRLARAGDVHGPLGFGPLSAKSPYQFQ